MWVVLKMLVLAVLKVVLILVWVVPKVLVLVVLKAVLILVWVVLILVLVVLKAIGLDRRISIEKRSGIRNTSARLVGCSRL